MCGKPKLQEEEEEEEEQSVIVKIPTDWKAGEPVKVDSLKGKEVEVEVPATCKEGEALMALFVPGSRLNPEKNQANIKIPDGVSPGDNMVIVFQQLENGKVAGAA